MRIENVTWPPARSMGDATGCTGLWRHGVCRLAGGQCDYIPGSARGRLSDLAPDLTRGVVDCVHIYVCAAVAQGIDQSRERQTGEGPDEVALGNGASGENPVMGHTTFDKSEKESNHRTVFTWLSEVNVSLGDFVDVIDCQLELDPIAGEVENGKAVSLAFNSGNFVLPAQFCSEHSALLALRHGGSGGECQQGESGDEHCDSSHDRSFHRCRPPVTRHYA